MFVESGALAHLLRPGQNQRQFPDVKRLDQIIDCAQAHRFDRVGHAAIGRHDNDGGCRGKSLFAQQIRSQAIGQIHIEEDEIELPIAQAFSGHGDGVGRGDIGAELFQIRG